MTRKNYTNFSSSFKLLFLSWFEKPSINRKITITLIILSFIASIVTFLVFSNSLPYVKSNSSIAITVLTIDVILLLFLCFKVVRRIIKIWSDRKKGYVGSKISTKFVLVFSLLALTPTIIVTIFSSLFFNLGMKTWFSDKILRVFEQSNIVADAYLDEHRENLRSDIIGISQEINKSFDVIFLDLNKLSEYINSQVYLRELTEVFIFKNNGALIAKAGFTISSTPDLITENELLSAENGDIIFTSKRSDRLRALIKLTSIKDSYLSIGKFVDPKIISQVNSVKAATRSYNEVLSKRKQIEINFYIVFILITLLILLIAILIALYFADNLISPISNLIRTSNLIKKGNLSAKVPQVSTKDEMGLLIKTFNQMTNTLKNQQNELRKRERNSAWSDIARRIAHEIKNPLTPIQLSAEYLKKKSTSKKYSEYAETIVKQVSSIEKMVDEFAKFARLPSPKFSKCDLNKLCKDLVVFHQNANPNIHFSLKSRKMIIANIDESQITMALNNIIKNSIESINEKYKKIKNFGHIKIDIVNKSKIINIKINDNGIGLPNSNLKNKILEPYITTKEKGTGLGLAIVLKIIQEHNGNFNIANTKTNNGSTSLIELPKNI